MRARRATSRRLQEYMGKALKEAKLHTSWINPNEEYERAVSEFVAALLDPAASADFLGDFGEFQRLTARAGRLNSLAQTLLKITRAGRARLLSGDRAVGLHAR